MTERVVVSGVGMVPFVATGSNASGIAERAIRNALDDAGIDVELVDQAVASHVHGDSAAGERAFARSGLTGIAVSNVSNGAASGSAALFHARQALLSGEAQVRARRRIRGGHANPTTAPPEARAALRCAARMARRPDGNRRRDVRARRGQGPRARGAQSVRAPSRSAVARARRSRTPLVTGRLRRSYMSGASCGAAAVVLCTPRFAALHGLRDDVLLAAHVLESDDPPIRGERRTCSMRSPRHDAPRGRERAYESAGVDPADIDVAEVHDCCVGDELISCAALGLCAEDDIERFVRSGANTYGGKVVVSPSGGLLSMGMRPAPPGSRKSASSPWQLRGEAGPRQVARRAHRVAAQRRARRRGGRGDPATQRLRIHANPSLLTGAQRSGTKQHAHSWGLQRATRAASSAKTRRTGERGATERTESASVGARWRGARFDERDRRRQRRGIRDRHRQSGRRDSVGQHDPLQPRLARAGSGLGRSSAIPTSTTATATSARAGSSHRFDLLSEFDLVCKRSYGRARERRLLVGPRLRQPRRQLARRRRTRS